MRSCPSQISIPAMSVTLIKKTKTALLVPNALVIETPSEQVRKHLMQSAFPRLSSQPATWQMGGCS